MLTRDQHYKLTKASLSHLLLQMILVGRKGWMKYPLTEKLNQIFYFRVLI